jgi:Prophage protein (DUF1660)
MKLLCRLLGHRDGPVEQDNRGAAWTRCRRCKAITAYFSWHGGRPWEKT